MLLYPKATARIVPYDTGGDLPASLGLILHVTQAAHSEYGYFSDPSHKAVSHWWVGKDGTVEQYVDAEKISWAQVAGNHTYHSVETEGWATEPLTDAQVKAIGALYRWGIGEFGWPLQIANAPGTRGLGIHSMGGIAWGGHACPGDLRAAQRQTILDAARVREDDDMAPIYRVTDGPSKDAEFFDYGFGPVHINGPESSELTNAGVKVINISGATFANRFKGVK